MTMMDWVCSVMENSRWVGRRGGGPSGRSDCETGGPGCLGSSLCELVEVNLQVRIFKAKTMSISHGRVCEASAHV